MAIEIRLENFTGPLDLLLHLIKSNEMDIADIHLVKITEQYLAVIEQMKRLDLDIAGEFLLMAATLIHIKSRMLLPVVDDFEDEEGEDPREELIRRLLEYQRYKYAAEMFDQRPKLNRDVFTSVFTAADIQEGGDEEEIAVPVGIYQLAQAFHQLLRDRPAEVFHEVVHEPLSVASYIDIIGQRLLEQRSVRFCDFFRPSATRNELVVTFLAMLELVKMRMIHIDQGEAFGVIRLCLSVSPEQMRESLRQSVELTYG